MGERGVDEIIQQWRDSARATGESVSDRVESPVRRGLARIGPVRAVLVVLAAVFFAVVAVRVAASTPGPDPLSDTAAESAALAAAAGAPAEAEAPAEAGQASGGPPTVDDWFALMRAVDRARGAAYAAADASPLATAFAPEGAAAAREGRVVAELAGRGVVAQGWRTDVLAVSVVEQTAEEVLLRVQDQRRGYRLIDGDGQPTEVPAREPRAWLVTLRLQDGSWLVVETGPDITSPGGQP